MVLKSKANKNSVPEWTVPEKFELYYKTLNSTPHIYLTSGVPTETGGAAINAVVRNPVTCVTKTYNLCTAHCTMNVTSYIRSKIQFDD